MVAVVELIKYWHWLSLAFISEGHYNLFRSWNSTQKEQTDTYISLQNFTALLLSNEIWIAWLHMQIQRLFSTEILDEVLDSQPNILVLRDKEGMKSDDNNIKSRGVRSRYFSDNHCLWYKGIWDWRSQRLKKIFQLWAKQKSIIFSPKKQVRGYCQIPRTIHE